MADLKGRILAGKVLVQPKDLKRKQLVELLFLIQLRKNHKLEK